MLHQVPTLELLQEIQVFPYVQNMLPNDTKTTLGSDDAPLFPFLFDFSDASQLKNR